MTVYKYFIKVALKNKGFILSYIIIFFILSIINGSTNVQRESSFIESRPDIGIIDYSETQLSKGLAEYLGKKNNIVPMVDDEIYIKEQVFLQLVDAVVIIPNDLESKVINRKSELLIYNDYRNISSYKVENQINKYLAFAVASYENGEFDIERVGSALEKSVHVDLMVTENGINERVNNWFKFYFNFTSYIILALYISVIGFVMIEFNEVQVENRRKISSIRFLDFNRQMYLGQLSMAAFISAIFILGSIVLKGKYIGEVNFAKYAINLTVFSIAALCLVFLVNNITNNRFVISAISTVLSLGLSFISGVMVPQEFLGEKVLSIAKFFPIYYFVKINETEIASILEVKYDILIQLLFAGIFLIMGLYLSRVKQRT
ncbi:MAG: ABC transporter permease [Tissierellaceae bacterium]|nr:ABC transporter permease [Tissierellaceae bacterium]